MKFRYFVNPDQINNVSMIQATTGLGLLYSNYKKVEHLTQGDDIFDIEGFNHTTNGGNQMGNGYMIAESESLPKIYWDKLSVLRNKLLVNSNWMKQLALTNSNIKENNVTVIPYLQDFDRINKLYQNSNDFLQLSTVFKDHYKYYNISQNKQIKGINELICAYMQQFSNNEKVLLVLKYPYFKFIPNVMHNRIFVLNQNPKIIVVDTMLDQQRLFSLHANCDCYVATTFGTGWQIPPFQAAHFKKTLLVGDHTALHDWVDFSIAIKLQSTLRKMKLYSYEFANFSPYYYNDKYASKHRLWEINYIESKQIAKKLRYSYDNRDQFKKTSENFNLQKFDISNINKYIKDGI